MTNKELKKVLDGIRRIPNESEREAVTQIVLKAAAESITLETLKQVTNTNQCKNSGNSSREKLKFSKAEIEKLPPALQKLLEKCGRSVACRTTEHGLYQARFRRNGYNVEVADKNFSALKEKFLQKLIAADNKKRQSEFPLFIDYAEDWLSVKRRVVKDSTYDGYALQLRRKLIPEFGDLPLNKVQRSAVQNYLFSFSDAGKHRTAHKLKTLLSAIFATAAEDFSALLNPMRKIVLERYSAKKGKAFTVQEERKIIEFSSLRREKNEHTGKACGAILLLLYTGMRIGELSSAAFDGTYITCVSEKTRKGKTDVLRKIPLSPMLKKVWYLIDFKSAISASAESIRRTLKQIFQGRHPHELRYTFITRAKECGCNAEVVMLWAGHCRDNDVSASRVDRGYTTFSDKFLINEMQKFAY